MVVVEKLLDPFPVARVTASFTASYLIFEPSLLGLLPLACDAADYAERGAHRRPHSKPWIRTLTQVH